MEAYGEMDVYIHIFLTSALVGGEWSVSHPGRFTPWESAPGTHWIGGWVGPTASLEKRKFFILDGLELRPLGHPARSLSPYRLRYSRSSTFYLYSMYVSSLIEFCKFHTQQKQENKLLCLKLQFCIFKCIHSGPSHWVNIINWFDNTVKCLHIF
jgi:hypothetical protein